MYSLLVTNILNTWPVWRPYGTYETIRWPSALRNVSNTVLKICIVVVRNIMNSIWLWKGKWYCWKCASLIWNSCKFVSSCLSNEFSGKGISWQLMKSEGLFQMLFYLVHNLYYKALLSSNMTFHFELSSLWKQLI